MSENCLEANVEMLSDFQTIEEQSKKDVSSENTCKKPSELHRSFDIIPTTTTLTQTMEDREDLFKMHLKNFTKKSQ